ncbi:hypothetical protein ACMZ7K_06210, partial [Gardnerella pickettii]|uniref:hypothetical protein n=2 Tax=Gardnerella TaxID=2701 RepID=UPI0039F09760
PKSKSHPNQQAKTIETKPKHRRVENTRKTITNHHNHQHKTKNNPKKQEKHPQKPKHGSVENKIDGQLTHNYPSIQSYLFLPIFALDIFHLL